MSKIKNGGLDQYGAQPFEQQQFRTDGAQGFNLPKTQIKRLHHIQNSLARTVANTHTPLLFLNLFSDEKSTNA